MNNDRILASITSAERFGDVGKATKFDALADQLVAIAATLRENAPSASATPHEKQTNPGNPSFLQAVSSLKDIRAANAEVAREIYATRRRRTAIFGIPELFGEPAWDIMLDLYIAAAEGKPVSVSSACIGSAAPPTTGLRWLGVLAENDLILREHDPEDQRRVLVRLTERGLAAMDEFFAGAANSA